LRTSYKEDIKASVAELVYGTTLRIPGEYFASEEPSGCPQMFVEKFREHMRTVCPVSTAHHIKPKPFIYKDLETSSHVFVRVDKPRKLLDQPYEGPFPIIKKLNESIYRINFKGQDQDINIDRLKPTFLEATQVEPDPTAGTSGTSTEQQPRRILKVTFKA